ncbi:MarR family winged helix-turn-helix transcriptional regulator [Nocardia stercoris]|uniref:MarR family transcriptional regulator n=1 Tax=Nocardia stercoris TaxID=2483361 RepID=A0A3M2L664_9NOCA|nr:MarR family winged helix-turn-helix transcriptional regulator [Nocardia stercoris]RMI33017.1 MarR family transcriptional regulator [Nocardia stercoris]
MTSTDRPDLAAMIVPLGRALMAAEQPILAAHDLTMWGYIVLQALGRGPARGQKALAAEIGADKTRIIPVLDDLQERGLIDRRPDPADRRHRLLELSPAGRRLRDRAQTDIRSREDALLDRLDPSVRRGFLTALTTLAAMPRAEIVGEGFAPE